MICMFVVCIEYNLIVTAPNQILLKAETIAFQLQKCTNTRGRERDEGEKRKFSEINFEIALQ